MKNKLIAFIIACIIAVGNIFGQGLTSSQIDSLVNKSMETYPIAGMAIAVVKDNTVVHMKGYGVTSIETKEKVDENTLFSIASNSKAFTTMALAMLVEEGKIKWTDKVVDIIPEFKMYDSYVTENFNILDLLTHRSGLADHAGDLLIFPDGSDFTMNDILKSFQYLKPVSAFRTKYDYNNLLYIVAGEVVKRVSGISWAEFVETKIMRTIGMERSAGIYQRINPVINIASPHLTVNGLLEVLQPFIRIDEIGSTGGIYASVNDLSIWMMLHLNEGKYGEKQERELITKQTHDELWKPYINISHNPKPELPNKNHFRAYGLGWALYDRAGYLIVEHSGEQPGMVSRILLLPELNAGIVTLMNTEMGGFCELAISQEIMDSYLNLEKKDWMAYYAKNLDEFESYTDSMAAAFWSTVSKTNINNLSIENYIGNYRDNWLGDIQIISEKGKLWFKSLRSPKLAGEMFYYKANTFALKWSYEDDPYPIDAFVMFNLDENGKAVGIKMKSIYEFYDTSFDYPNLDFKRIDE